MLQLINIFQLHLIIKCSVYCFTVATLLHLVMQVQFPLASIQKHVAGTRLSGAKDLVFDGLMIQAGD